jgi:hypothetical protein
MASEEKTTMVMKKVKQMTGVHIGELLNRVERAEWGCCQGAQAICSKQ